MSETAVQMIAEFLPHVCEPVRKALESSRFPFTYHHDYVRQQIPGTLSQGEIAVMTKALFPNSEEYDRQVACGALAYVMEVHAADILDHILRADSPEVLDTYRQMKAMANQFRLEPFRAKAAFRHPNNRAQSV